VLEIWKPDGSLTSNDVITSLGEHGATDMDFSIPDIDAAIERIRVEKAPKTQKLKGACEGKLVTAESKLHTEGENDGKHVTDASTGQDGGGASEDQVLLYYALDAIWKNCGFEDGARNIAHRAGAVSKAATTHLAGSVYTYWKTSKRDENAFNTLLSMRSITPEVVKIAVGRRVENEKREKIDNSGTKMPVDPNLITDTANSPPSTGQNDLPQHGDGKITRQNDQSQQGSNNPDRPAEWIEADKLTPEQIESISCRGEPSE